MSNFDRFCLLGFALLTAASTSANERLTSLYEKIRQQSSEEALYNDEREARFRQFADERALMLRDVEARVAQLCLLYTSPSPRDRQKSRMPSSA